MRSYRSKLSEDAAGGGEQRFRLEDAIVWDVYGEDEDGESGAKCGQALMILRSKVKIE